MCSSVQGGWCQLELEVGRSIETMCEDLGGLPDCLEQGEVDQVLTAVVQGIRKEEPDPEVRPRHLPF
jgi:hypothetical protein